MTESQAEGRAHGPPASGGLRSTDRPASTRFLVLVFGSLVVLIAVSVLGLAYGAVTLSFADVWAGLTSDTDRLARSIVWDIRVPRLLDGMIVGASLAVAGTLLQGATRNPLADPTIMGMTAAAGLVSSALIAFNPQVGHWAIVLACMVGATAGAAAIFVISWRGAVSPVRLALAGVALSSFFGAFIVAILASSRTFLQTSLGFLAGGLYGSNWVEFQHALPYLAIGMAGAMLLAGRLNILSLGDDIAAGLGVLTDRSRAALLLVAAILTGVAVSIAGLVSFVGLVCPHIARFMVGSDNRYVIPASALLGAVLVTGADLAARLVIRPSEIPMGIVTAAVGAPFLLYLLRSRA